MNNIGCINETKESVETVKVMRSNFNEVLTLWDEYTSKYNALAEKLEDVDICPSLLAEVVASLKQVMSERLKTISTVEYIKNTDL